MNLKPKPSAPNTESQSTNSKLALNENEAATYADEIGYPVVLKIVSPDIIHKSDAGGVIVNLKTPADVTTPTKKSWKTSKNTKQTQKSSVF